MRLRTKFFWAAAGLVLLVGVGLIGVLHGAIRGELERQLTERTFTLARHLASMAGDPFLTEDELGLGMILHEAVESEAFLLYAFVARPTGEVVAHTFEGGFPPDLRPGAATVGTRRYHTLEGPVFDVGVPVLAGLAVLHAGASAVEIQQALARSVERLVGVVSAGVVLGMFMALFLAGRVSQPLERLTEATVAVGNGDLGQEVPERGGVEVRTLATSFNRMVDRVRSARDELLDLNRELTNEHQGLLEAVARNEQLQAQLLQAQKLESVGRLSGGIAHEFNNLLCSISAAAELAERKVAPDHPVRPKLDLIVAAAERGGDLARQLLAFGRQQVIQPRQIDLNRNVVRAATLLGRILGDDVTVETRLDPDLPLVEVDPDQLDHVLVNLAVNAREAMPEGGGIELGTGIEVLPAVDENPDAPVAGTYAVVSVADTGKGMPAEVCERALEPFFTTKPVGDGAGLGLSTAYGIVKQHGGHLSLESHPGRGTTVRVYLPVV